MKAKNLLEDMEGNVGDASNNIDLVMAANTQESEVHNNNIMSQMLTVKSLQKKVH
jgi:hypothetical protein